MKHVELLSTGVLLLLLGIVAPTFAQERHEEEAKAPKQEEQAKPEKQQHAVSQQKQEKEQQKQAKGQQKQEKEQQKQAKGQQKQEKEQQKQAVSRQKQEKDQQKQAKGQQKQEKDQQKQAKGQQKQEREQRPQAMGQQSESSPRPQRTPQQEARQRREPALRLSARGEGRIPDDRFRSKFGHEHRFHIGSPRMVGGYSRFQYGGYWFGFVEPWPGDWYYTDDVYIDYIDGGYYLYDPYYPGVRIAICVVL